MVDERWASVEIDVLCVSCASDKGRQRGIPRRICTCVLAASHPIQIGAECEKSWLTQQFDHYPDGMRCQLVCRVCEYGVGDC